MKQGGITTPQSLKDTQNRTIEYTSEGEFQSSGIINFSTIDAKNEYNN
jgi:hypothetical protein